MRWEGMGHACRKRKIHIECWSDSMKERDHLEDLGIDVRTILKWVLKKKDGRAWTE
jgi:uncharacterized protein YjcR